MVFGWIGIKGFTVSRYTLLAMFQSKSDYDRGVNTFSPEGRIFQIEYAIEAIKLGILFVFFEDLK